MAFSGFAPNGLLGSSSSLQTDSGLTTAINYTNEKHGGTSQIDNNKIGKRQLLEG